MKVEPVLFSEEQLLSLAEFQDAEAERGWSISIKDGLHVRIVVALGDQHVDVVAPPIPDILGSADVDAAINFYRIHPTDTPHQRLLTDKLNTVATMEQQAA